MRFSTQYRKRDSKDIRMATGVDHNHFSLIERTARTCCAAFFNFDRNNDQSQQVTDVVVDVEKSCDREQFTSKVKFSIQLVNCNKLFNI